MTHEQRTQVRRSEYRDYRDLEEDRQRRKEERDRYATRHQRQSAKFVALASSWRD